MSQDESMTAQKPILRGKLQRDMSQNGPEGISLCAVPQRQKNEGELLETNLTKNCTAPDTDGLLIVSR